MLPFSSVYSCWMGLRQVRFKALQGLRPARLHSLEIWSGLGGRGDDARPKRQRRLAALLGEGHGGEHFEERLAGFVEGSAGKDEPLGRDDLLIHARHRID